jgi:hypothetical protein
MMTDILIAILIGVVLTASMAKLSLTLNESITYIFGSQNASWFYCPKLSYKCKIWTFYSFSGLFIFVGVDQLGYCIYRLHNW